MQRRPDRNISLDATAVIRSRSTDVAYSATPAKLSNAVRQSSAYGSLSNTQHHTQHAVNKFREIKLTRPPRHDCI
jgi:hypothetical protein